MESRRATCGPGTLKTSSPSSPYPLMSSSCVLLFFSKPCSLPFPSSIYSPSSLRHPQRLVLIIAFLFLIPHSPLNAHFLSSFIMSLFSPHPLALFIFTSVCRSLCSIHVKKNRSLSSSNSHVFASLCSCLSLWRTESCREPFFLIN